MEQAMYVSLQFSFTEISYVPASIQSKPGVESLEEAKFRRGRSNGQIVIPKTVSAYIRGVPGDLLSRQYVLIEAIHLVRPVRMARLNGRVYHSVRYVFCRHDLVDDVSYLLAKNTPLMPGLDGLCTNYMWEIRAYVNPAIRRGEEMPYPQNYGVTLNLSKLTRLFEKDGRRRKLRPAGARVFDYDESWKVYNPKYFVTIDDKGIAQLNNYDTSY